MVNLTLRLLSAVCVPACKHVCERASVCESLCVRLWLCICLHWTISCKLLCWYGLLFVCVCVHNITGRECMFDLSLFMYPYKKAWADTLRSPYMKSRWSYCRWESELEHDSKFLQGYTHLDWDILVWCVSNLNSNMLNWCVYTVSTLENRVGYKMPTKD